MSGGIQHFVVNNTGLNVYDDGLGLSVGGCRLEGLTYIDGQCRVVFSLHL